jgi:hypothetical protein
MYITEPTGDELRDAGVYGQQGWTDPFVAALEPSGLWDDTHRLEFYGAEASVLEGIANQVAVLEIQGRISFDDSLLRYPLAIGRRFPAARVSYDGWLTRPPRPDEAIEVRAIHVSAGWQPAVAMALAAELSDSAVMVAEGLGLVIHFA